MAKSKAHIQAAPLINGSSGCEMGPVVVIGFAEALAAPEVTWSLADAGLKVVAFTREGRRPALRSSRYVSLFEIAAPESSTFRALADLKQHLSSLPQGKAALMPLDDTAVWLCSNLNMDIPIVGPTRNAAPVALNKWTQIAYAKKAGFSVPSTRYVENGNDVFIEPVRYPVVFKPALAVRECGNRVTKGRAWLCSERQELDSAMRSWAEREPMLLQEFIPGVGEGLFGLATSHGVVGWSAHRRLRMMNPEGSGSSACTSATVDADLRALGERFVVESAWRGLFMIELLREASGTVWFIELNGRAWGSMALARRMGFEYPAWAVRQALDPAVQPVLPEASDQPLLCRHLGRELIHLLYILRGSRSKAVAGRTSRFSSFRQVLNFRRSHRWYNWRGDDRKVFISDLFSTLREQLFKPKESN